MTTGALERSLAALTIGIAQDSAQRAKALADVYQGEHIQQLQVPLSGKAYKTWVYADKEFRWEMPFLYAPQQRQVPFAVPHFSAGFEFTSPLTDLVVLHAHVLSWVTADEGWVMGASVRFASHAPLAVDATVRWGAMAHLSFQGYATFAEGDEYTR